MHRLVWCVAIGIAHAACSSSPDGIDRADIREAEHGFADLQWCLFGQAVPGDADVAPRLLAQRTQVHGKDDPWPERCAPYAHTLRGRASRAGLDTIADATLRVHEQLLPRWPDLPQLAASWTTLARAAREELGPVPATRVPSPPPAQPPLVDAEAALVPSTGASEQRHADELAARVTGSESVTDTKQLGAGLLDLPGSSQVGVQPAGPDRGRAQATIAIGDDLIAAWIGPGEGVFVVRSHLYAPAEPILVLKLPRCDRDCSPSIGLAAASSDVVLTLDSGGRRYAVRVTELGRAEPIPR